MSIPVGKSRLGTLLAALLVTCGLAFALASQPPAAYAVQIDKPIKVTSLETQAQSSAVTVALTIYDEQDDRVLYNGKVIGLSGSNTVTDLLKAAGFEKVDAYAGDPDSYTLDPYGAGSPYFLGKASEPTGDTTPEGWPVYWYWSTMCNGSSNNYADAYLDQKLKNSYHYQYIYTTNSAFSYSANIPDPLTTEISKANLLLNNLADRFGEGGTNGQINNGTYGAALGLGYLGFGDSIDTEALKSGFASSTTAGRAAKYIQALSAAGIDVSDYVARMEQLENSASDGFYDFVMILPAYRTLITEPSVNAYSKATMIENILAQQDPESKLFPLKSEYDVPNVMATAEAIFALAPYRDEESKYPGIAEALESAHAAVLAKVNASNGKVDSAWGYQMDYDGMGELIDALRVYGGNDLSIISKMADALVAGADSTLDGYKADKNNYDETMVAADAFRGLAAAREAGWNRVYLDNVVDMRVDIDDVDAEAATKKYTGKALTPVLTLEDDETPLAEGADYKVVGYLDKNKKSVAASKLKAAGTYYVRVEGLGTYYGTTDVEFVISKASITKKMVGSVKNKKYNGKKYNPVPKVTFNKKALKKGSNTFKVTYLNKNKKAIKASKVKKAGKYYVKVTGQGNFTGSVTKAFKIVKK